ncbi:MAG: hypothetical protein U0136_01520 [Bdellovibrionota bacterium]
MDKRFSLKAPSRKLIVLALTVLSCCVVHSPADAIADGGALEDGYEPPQPTRTQGVAPQVDQSSSNFKKTKKFLPGEEVVTPTGKTVKVWSTEGPVPVSRAPQPFDDPNASQHLDTHIVVDDDLLRRRAPLGNPPRESPGFQGRGRATNATQPSSRESAPPVQRPLPRTGLNVEPESGSASDTFDAGASE